MDECILVSSSGSFFYSRVNTQNHGNISCTVLYLRSIKVNYIISHITNVPLKPTDATMKHFIKHILP